jgi:hypothetical protein
MKNRLLRRSALQVERSVTPRSAAIGRDTLCDSARISQQHPQAAVTTFDDHVLIDSCAGNANLTASARGARLF